MSSHPDCIFEIHYRWQSGFSRVYSNCCCSCWFEPEILKIGQSSHKVYSNNIVNFQESTTILNACTKTVWKLSECTTYLLQLKCLVSVALEKASYSAILVLRQLVLRTRSEKEFFVPSFRAMHFQFFWFGFGIKMTLPSLCYFSFKWHYYSKHIALVYIYIYIYIYVYIEMNRSSKRFVFFKNYLFCS